MTVATLTVPNLPAARAARDAGMAATESRIAAEQDRLVIDNVITYLADLGEPFSVNEARELLPAVSGPLIGARFHAAAARGDIERIGDTQATHESGHARRISVWVKAQVTRSTLRADLPEAGSNPVANGKQVAKQSASRPLTPAEEQTVRSAHWALEGKGGIRSTGDARKLIRSLLDVVGAITGIDSGDDTLMLGIMS